jgi:hypothetical protein
VTEFVARVHRIRELTERSPEDAQELLRSWAAQTRGILQHNLAVDLSIAS